MTTLLLAIALAQSVLGRSGTPATIDDADLTAVDALGRVLPTYAQAGPPKPDRWVGMFYWQWHGDDRWGADYNMTEFLQSHPGFRDFSAHPAGGPNNPTWYWGEPLFGYYRSTDPWVIRKHLGLLSHAGVDFLFLDYTNGSVYDDELATFLKVAKELKSKGLAVPRLSFFLNYEPNWKIESLYTKWYKPGLYDDMWFTWQGKPLILSPRPADAQGFKDPSLLAAVQNFFTWRPTWALFESRKDPTKWRFMDTLQPDGRPRAALGPDGKPEQIVVNKSMGGPIWDNMKSGGVSTYPGHEPVYDGQWLSGDQAKGLFFQRSWDAALAHPAPMLLVTGWNEWKASVWETPGVVMLGRRTAAGQGHIVDEFNMDFNRDVEPMRGGYGDDYYWQFLANMRMYKGMRPPQAVSKPKTIRVDGPLAQWDGVTPVYRDADGDAGDRDWDGTVPHSHFVDKSARNDIAMAQVARDRQNLYFRVRTASSLTPPEGRSWMLLFIDADGDARTGWNGYDLLVNRDRSGAGCTIEQNVGGAWSWKPVGRASLHWHGQDLVLSVPRKLVEASSKKRTSTIGFKWADNLPEEPTAFDFYSKGDVAPDARFNYVYPVR